MSRVESTAVVPYPGDAAAGAPPDAVPWRDLLAACRRRWWLPLAAPLVLGGAVGYLLSREPPKYRATAVLLIGDARRALTSGLETRQADRHELTDPVLSHVQLLRSRGLLRTVVDSAGLRLVPEFRRGSFDAALLEDVVVTPEAPPDTLTMRFGAWSFTAAGRWGRATAPYGEPVTIGGVSLRVVGAPDVRQATWTVLPLEAAVDRLLAELRTSRRPGTNIVDVSYTAYRAAVAERVVNTIARMFQAEGARGAQEQSRRRRRFLEAQLLRTDSLLSGSQLALSGFRTREQVYSAREKLAAQQRELLELSVREQQLAAQHGMYQKLVARLRSPRPAERESGLRTLASAPEVVANPIVTQVYGQLLRYQGTRDSLMAGAWASAATNPDVRRLDGLITATETQLTSVLASQLTSLGARLGAVRAQRAQAAAELRALPAAEAREVRLLEDVETMRRLSEQLREEYQRAHIAEAVEVGEVEIVDLAARPYRPVPGHHILKLGLALVLGLLLGGGGAVSLEWLNTSIRRRDDLEGTLRAPALGIIPQVANGRRRPLAGLLAPFRVSPAPATPAPGAAAPPSPTLVTLARRPSFGAEAYRLLRANLLNAPDAARLKTVLITSTVVGEGKTTTAANLACELARDGLRVVLVDADLWRGQLHRLFGVARSPGLSEYLNHRAEFTAVLRSTSAPRVWLLPRGGANGNPSALLSGARMRSLLAELRTRCDLVVLDTPPVLAAADAAILSAVADGVVLVVRAGKTDRAAVQEAARQVAAAGGRLIGAVLNDPAGVTVPHGSYHYAYVGAADGK
jgi:capsular exopolysaccharide synthesis family protein